MNCGRMCYTNYHLASNLLPHYLAKLECLTVQLYNKVIQFRSAQNLQNVSTTDVMCSIEMSVQIN